jgi:L-2-hydroxyglutarate oxidase LhgO
MESVECLVVGAGVIGLAVARALARAGREVIVVESESGIGAGVSSRNSEVIHAGIYYRTGLDKTRLCVDGNAMLYAFCQEFGVPHKRCGKLLVAVNAGEVDKLTAIKAQAEANGVADLVWLSGEEARALEPALVAERALLSPSTGIIDSHAFMLALRGDAEAHGAMFAFETPVLAGCTGGEGLVIEVGGPAPTRLAAGLVVNAAGLSAQALAHSIAGMPVDKIPPLHLAKGNYFSLSGRSPFSRLIYPMPTPGGLGVHLTLDLAGQAKFGPDVEWVDAIDYGVDPRRAASFYTAIRTYWPGLPEGALQPGYAGVRPKIARPGGSTTDFLLQTEKEHGVAGLINLFGIESPGLTASLAIADWLAHRVSGQTHTGTLVRPPGHNSANRRQGRSGADRRG